MYFPCPILQAKEEQNAMELKYQNELTAHVKLSSLYKVNYILLLITKVLFEFQCGQIVLTEKIFSCKVLHGV